MPSNMGETGYSGAIQGGSAARGYETRDANTGAVLGFLGFLLLVLVTTLFGSWLLFRYFSISERGPLPGSSFAGVRQIPSGPELEANPREDLLRNYAEQQQRIESYSWEDRKAGTVRIPVERAMDLLLQKGLPVVSSAAVDNSNDAASEPNGEREKAERK